MGIRERERDGKKERERERVNEIARDGKRERETDKLTRERERSKRIGFASRGNMVVSCFPHEKEIKRDNCEYDWSIFGWCPSCSVKATICKHFPS